MSDAIRLAYLAGIIDGEGCITVARQSRNKQPTVTVAVNMTDRRALDLLQEQFGGSVVLCKARNERSKPPYQWKCQAKKAEALLRALRPYLIIKAEQADLCLVLRDSMHGDGILPRGLTVNPEKTDRINAFRDGIVAQIRVLNQRGALHVASGV